MQRSLDESFSTLILSIVEEDMEPGPCPNFVHALRLYTEADFVNVVMRPQDSSTPPLVDFSSGARPSALARLCLEPTYDQEFGSNDSEEDVRIYKEDEFLEVAKSETGSSAPRNDQDDLPRMRLMRIPVAGGISARILIAKGYGNFEAEMDELLRAIAPYLRHGLQAVVERAREKVRSKIGAFALQRLGIGWLTLDYRGCVVEANDLAKDLLAKSDEISYSRDRRLQLGSLKLNTQLRRAVRLFAEKPGNPPRVVRISEDRWMELLLVPLPTEVFPTATAARIIAYIRKDSRATVDRVTQMVHLFDLLPSEAKLATALVEGLSITEAATELGLAVSTARNYSKQIYSKIGARGKSDLIRLVLTSVLAIA